MQRIIQHQPGDFVVFVTFGREQGDHKFEEGITSEGVLTWQSQPNQSLNTPQVKRLISHDSERGNVRLFLRTRERGAGGTILPYTYLGRLSYLTHDTERERPVYFKWQMIDTWPPPDDVLRRMALSLTQSDAAAFAPEHAGLTQTPPPIASPRKGKRTADFRGFFISGRESFTDVARIRLRPFVPSCREAHNKAETQEANRAVVGKIVKVTPAMPMRGGL